MGKKNCYGCRALEMGNCLPCKLGYRVKFIKKYPESRFQPVPAYEYCPKPRTYGALNDLLILE